MKIKKTTKVTETITIKLTSKILAEMLIKEHPEAFTDGDFRFYINHVYGEIIDIEEDTPLNVVVTKEIIEALDEN